MPPTCNGYICPVGHVCQVMQGEPKCLCRLKCTETDYLSGPICTTNLQRFSNYCQFKKVRCLSPSKVLDILPKCPKEGLKCSQLNSINQIKPKLSMHLDDMINQPSLFKRKFNYLWPVKYTKSNLNLFRSKRRFQTQWKTFPFLIKSINDNKIKTENEKNESKIIQNELNCKPNEYCLLKQFNGQPECELWNKDSYKDLYNNCPSSTFKTPICATNNQTYQNSCELKLDSLKLQFELRIAYLGECKGNLYSLKIKIFLTISITIF